MPMDRLFIVRSVKKLRKVRVRGSRIIKVTASARTVVDREDAKALVVREVLVSFVNKYVIIRSSI